MPSDRITLLVMILPLIIALTGLAATVIVDRFTEKRQKRILLIIVTVLFSLVAQNLIEYRLSLLSIPTFLRTVASIYGYSVRPFVIVLFLMLFAKRSLLLKASWVLSLVNILATSTAMFSGIVFYFDENNHFQRGPLGNITLYISIVMLAIFLILSVKECYRMDKAEAVLPILNVVIVIATTVLDYVVSRSMPIPFLTDGMVLCSVFYFIWLHLHFAYEHEQDIIRGQNVKLMLSQIQPHFLYNSLSSISALCEIDPQRAQKLTDDFAEYLRGNLDSLTTEKLISFEKQLEQTGFYLNIEKTRFGDRVNVVYDIKANDFELPTLTLQPLVENAVRHGICKKEKGGTVTVRTYETEREFVVEISDDGVGFDTGRIKVDDKTHIGLDNVRSRLKYYGDTLEVTSEVNVGTTVTIRVPKELSRKEG